MNRAKIEDIVRKIYEHELDSEEGIKLLSHLPYEDIGFATIDHHRELRQGFPEVIYCEGKSDRQVVEIVGKMLERGSDILATRASEELFAKVKDSYPEAEYNIDGRVIYIRRGKKELVGNILVATAGTSDIPVAEEAAITAEVMGSKINRLYDVGVAGIHRLLGQKEAIYEANIIIVAAGMDGALASVIGGLADKPVIAVPTSVGYGASFQGLSALLAMLNSCAPGVAVMNIDNGFGAGCFAHRVNLLASNKS
ncbi:MAG: nickel pincer cofactor biosynthesis protein LarB [Nitrospinota bacterium]